MDNNAHLKKITVKNNTYYLKDGYDYMLANKHAASFCFTEAVLPGHIGECYDVCNDKYVSRPDDIFEIDESERKCQLKKNWRVRFPIPKEAGIKVKQETS